MNLNQINLFGKKTIKSISFNEQELIRDILYLHCEGRAIELDPTYSIGNFYKKGLTKPLYKFDIQPQIKGVVKSCSTKLPLNNESINVMMFDPPFMFEKRNRENTNIMNKRFSMYHNGFNELEKHYKGTLKEAYRIIKNNGCLIFKCQDFTDSKTTLTHCFVNKWANEIGFYTKDLFILLSKGVIANNNITQRHARKYHSYFFVFIKKKKK
tara:strand:- start:1226 stop:1858 length:633 start_codon:yes stop_codon:yes gene_type:complete